MKNDKAESTNRRVFIKRSAEVGAVAALNEWGDETHERGSK